MTEEHTDTTTPVLIRSLLRAYPDFPKPGILFQDIFPIFSNPAAVRQLITHLATHCRQLLANDERVDVVVGLDARGFLFGPMLAQEFGAAFVPVRKDGKLPGECATVTYEKEYGADRLQMQRDAIGISEGAGVVVMDDLLATGGTAFAAEELVRAVGGRVLACLFVVELTALKGRERL